MHKQGTIDSLKKLQKNDCMTDARDLTDGFETLLERLHYVVRVQQFAKFLLPILTFF